MASTYSNLKIQLMATGENSGTWGNVTNDNLGVALEEAIVGSADVTFASANVTLTLTNTNASQTARNLRLNLTGTTGGARDLIVPAIEKVYIVNNGCADTVTIKVTGQTGIAVPAGKTLFVYNNGTDCVDAITHLTSLTLATALPIASGGTGSTSTTYANLQSNVSGVLPIANGGTGSSTAAGALTNLGAYAATNPSGYVTTAGARSALSFSAGSGAYNSTTGVITIPTNNNQITNGAGYTTNTGTVTSVATSGSINGLTLSGGTITTTGTITLGGSITSVNTSSNFQMNSLGVGTAASGTGGEIRATNNVTAFYSDKRLKEIAGPINNALNKVSKISGVYYKQNKLAESFGYNNYEQQVGVIAQEIQEVLPEAVKFAPFDREVKDGKEVSKSGEEYLTVQYEKLVPLLIEAIKELSEKVEKLGG
jgi:hypothetical protein